MEVLPLLESYGLPGLVIAGLVYGLRVLWKALEVEREKRDLERDGYFQRIEAYTEPMNRMAQTLELMADRGRQS